MPIDAMLGGPVRAAARRRRKRRQGKPNGLPPTMAAILVEARDTWGPAMRALPSDRHRAFVLAHYLERPGHGLGVRAAKAAGFGTSTTTAKSWSVIASIYSHDERIQEALREEDQKHLRASGPYAVRALRGLVENPNHRDHMRAVATVLDRTQPLTTTHHVSVEHTERHVVVATEKVLERIRQLTLLAGLDPAGLPPMIQIEGECTEITPAAVEQKPKKKGKRGGR